MSLLIGNIAIAVLLQIINPSMGGAARFTTLICLMTLWTILNIKLEQIIEELKK
jgi:hypothetical protein